METLVNIAELSKIKIIRILIGLYMIVFIAIFSFKISNYLGYYYQGITINLESTLMFVQTFKVVLPMFLMFFVLFSGLIIPEIFTWFISFFLWRDVNRFIDKMTIITTVREKLKDVTDNRIKQKVVNIAKGNIDSIKYLTKILNVETSKRNYFHFLDFTVSFTLSFFVVYLACFFGRYINIYIDWAFLVLIIIINIYWIYNVSVLKWFKINGKLVLLCLNIIENELQDIITTEPVIMTDESIKI